MHIKAAIKDLKSLPMVLSVKMKGTDVTVAIELEFSIDAGQRNRGIEDGEEDG